MFAGSGTALKVKTNALTGKYSTAVFSAGEVAVTAKLGTVAGLGSMVGVGKSDSGGVCDRGVGDGACGVVVFLPIEVKKRKRSMPNTMVTIERRTIRSMIGLFIH